MKLIKPKCYFFLGCLLFCFFSFVHSQCDIKFIKNSDDNLIFHSTGSTDSLRGYVRVCLTYHYEEDFKGVGWVRTGIDIKRIVLITKSNNQNLKISDCSDTAYRCICDTLNKYIRLYYNDPNRILTAFELRALDSSGFNYPPPDSVKVELPFPSIYIYPYKKNKKSEYHRPSSIQHSMQKK